MFPLAAAGILPPTATAITSASPCCDSIRDWRAQSRLLSMAVRSCRIVGGARRPFSRATTQEMSGVRFCEPAEGRARQDSLGQRTPSQDDDTAYRDCPTVENGHPRLSYVAPLSQPPSAAKLVWRGVRQGQDDQKGLKGTSLSRTPCGGVYLVEFAIARILYRQLIPPQLLPP